MTFGRFGSINVEQSILLWLDGPYRAWLLVKIFAIFNEHDEAQRGCLPPGDVYKMIGKRKSIFGDSLFELIGEP